MYCSWVPWSWTKACNVKDYAGTLMRSARNSTPSWKELEQLNGQLLSYNKDLVHHWTISVTIHVSLKALLWTTPAHVANLKQQISAVQKWKNSSARVKLFEAAKLCEEKKSTASPLENAWELDDSGRHIKMQQYVHFTSHRHEGAQAVSHWLRSTKGTCINHFD